MIDRAENWAEFSITFDANAIYNAVLYVKEWLWRYPKPLQVIIDNGKEFLGKELQEK